MKKLVIFNVGGALSTYIEIDDKKIIVDLGAGNGFSPVDDFLIPLSSRRNFGASEKIPDKIHIDQLFISHLDNDHLNDYEKFRDAFHPVLLTAPNDNSKPSRDDELPQKDDFKVTTTLLGEELDVRNLLLDDLRVRQPIISTAPLGSVSDQVSLYYITPKDCERDEELNEHYRNNISLVIFIRLNEKSVLLPGDIQTEGMNYLIDNNAQFIKNLNTYGIDYLVAPHHGLSSSFSERLYNECKGQKVRLNIISEKLRTQDSEENRSEVDRRYYSSNYSSSLNSLNQAGVKTSGGHILIDLESPETDVKQIIDNEDLLAEFLL